MIKIKDIAIEKAVELGINPKAAAYACYSIGECIRHALRKVDLSEGPLKTPEELKDVGFSFNLHMMGKIQANYIYYKTIKEKIDNAKSRKNNTSI